MSIPLLDLKAQFAGYRAEALDAITRVCDSQRFIMGPEVTAFEAELARYMDVPHAVGVSSGTDALLAVLMALGVGPGDEVVTTPYTFFATAGVISRVGATPVFVDVDPGTLNLSEGPVRAAITPRTRAIIPVHLFGQVADLGALYEAPDRPPIIEDAAQALGASLRGRRVGHLGEYSTVSFFPAKNLGAFGDAGAVSSRDTERAAQVRVMRVHGSEPKYLHHVVGGNFRLDALQAAVLRVKLPLLDGWAEARRANAARYEAAFTEAGLVDRGLVKLPTVTPGARHVYNQYVIEAEGRDALRAALAEVGIGTAVYYPRPLHLQPCFAYLGYARGDLPVAEAACDRVLALPVYPELPEGSVRRVVAAISGHYGLR